MCFFKHPKMSAQKTADKDITQMNLVIESFGIDVSIRYVSGICFETGDGDGNAWGDGDGDGDGKGGGWGNGSGFSKGNGKGYGDGDGSGWGSGDGSGWVLEKFSK